MSAFRELRECSVQFEKELKHQATKLYCVKAGKTIDDVIVEKLQDISFYQSKFRLLHAKMKAVTPQVCQRVKGNADILKDYEVTARQKLLETTVVKSMTQSCVVKSLIQTPNSKLSPDLLEKKEKIIGLFNSLRAAECQLRQLDSVMVEREETYATVQQEWDGELGELRQRRQAVVPHGQVEPSGSLYKRLQGLVSKMELIRWLIGRLVTARTSYDWLDDPDNRLQVLALTREENTVQRFMENSF